MQAKITRGTIVLILAILFGAAPIALASAVYFITTRAANYILP